MKYIISLYRKRKIKKAIKKMDYDHQYALEYNNEMLYDGLFMLRKSWEKLLNN